LDRVRIELPAFFLQEWTYASADLCELVRKRAPGMFRLNDFAAGFARQVFQTALFRVGCQDGFKLAVN